MRKKERVAQASTTTDHKVDLEYHVIVEFSIDGNKHKVYIKCFTTTSSIQIQGKGEHKQREYFGNNHSPFTRISHDRIREKEPEFIEFLRNEIDRLKGLEKEIKKKVKQVKEKCQIVDIKILWIQTSWVNMEYVLNAMDSNTSTVSMSRTGSRIMSMMVVLTTIARTVCQQTLN